MRILRFDLLAYGHFTDTSLDLSSDGLHLIHGPNEAGKSTTLRALVDFFYGIPVQTRDGFLHSMQKLRLGAHLQRSGGDQLELVRHKRRKNSLLDSAGEPFPEERMAHVLGGVGRAAFESMFALDHTRLRAGGKRLLETGGELGESLFGAGLGRGVPDLLGRLRDEAGRLFRPQAKIPPLNKALRDFEAARESSQQLALRPQAWKDAHDDVARSQTALKQLGDAQRELDRERAQVQRWLRVLPLLAELEESERERARLDGIVLLPVDAADVRTAAENEIDAAGIGKERVEAEIVAIRDELGSLQVPTTLLEHGSRLDRLAEDAPACKRALRGLPRAEGELASTLDEVQTTLRRLGHGEELGSPSASGEELLEAGRALVVEHATEVQILRLAQESAKLEERLDGQQRAVDLGEAEHTRLALELEGLTAPEDWRDLAAVAQRVRGEGDVEAQLRVRVSGLDDLRVRARRAALELGLEVGDLAAGARLPVPQPETLTRFEERVRHLDRESDRARERLAEIDEHAERVRLSLEQLELRGALPTEDELARARDVRGELWRQVRSAWLRESATEQADEPAGAEFLGQEFEGAVTRADEAADALCRDADRVAHARELRSTAMSLDRQRESASAALASCDDDRQALQREWGELWAPTEVTPRSPAEMQGWLTRRAQLVELVDACATVEAERAAVEATLAQCKEQLGSAIAGLTGSAVDAADPLDTLLRISEAAVEDARGAAGARASLQGALEDLAGRQAASAGELAAAQQALDLWRREWRQAVAQIGLPPDAGCDAAKAVLDDLRTLALRIEQADQKRRSVQATRHEAAVLAADVGELVQAAAEDLAGVDPVDAADELLRRRRVGDTAAILATEKARRLGEKEDELAALAEQGALATRRLAKLVTEAGCIHVSQLREVEKDSTRARQLDARIEALRRDILLQGGGVSVSALRTETERVDVDALPGRLDALEGLLRGNRREQDEVLEALGRQKSELERMDGSAAAAEAAAEAEEELASVRSLSDKYVRYHLAACLLEAEIERYRSENQAPLVARAGELFARMTRQAYHGLRADFDERGEPVLRCLRDGGQGAQAGEAVALEDLSDGTADQLYLALRLASLERQVGPPEAGADHGAGAEPLPLVFDDAFIHFDEERSVAAFEVLAEVARHTQVLFFTHHARLRELARQAIPRDRLTEHDLQALRAGAASVGR